MSGDDERAVQEIARDPVLAVALMRKDMEIIRNDVGLLKKAVFSFIGIVMTGFVVALLALVVKT